jgi:dihydropteroate synthase-like protein
MSEHILFLTGRLAETYLAQVLDEMGERPFTYEIRQIGLQVAALMTADLVRRRVTDTGGADRVVVPGWCRGDLAALSEELGTPVERGPKEVKDLPRYLGGQAVELPLTGRPGLLFAEITEAPNLTPDAILAEAAALREAGADVIDLGCLPEADFPHLEESVNRLRGEGLRVSVDSLDERELVRGAAAGAEFLVSLTEDTLWVVDEWPASTPVLIPRDQGDLDSLARAMAAMEERGLAYFADPILDPFPFGITDSLVRFHEIRRRFPRADLFMGIGNATELMDADTVGINALLTAIAQELAPVHLLTTQVSPHCRQAVREADLGSRLMATAAGVNTLPKGVNGSLMVLRDREPYRYSLAEIEALAEQVRDPSFRIQVSAEGIHIYNRDGFHTATDPFALYPSLGVEDDASHAFYLGAELARAQIAWQLGKEYHQDQPLAWGAIVPAPEGNGDD